jgi:hypothetical protein
MGCKEFLAAHAFKRISGSLAAFFTIMKIKMHPDKNDRRTG